MHLYTAQIGVLNLTEPKEVPISTDPEHWWCDVTVPKGTYDVLATFKWEDGWFSIVDAKVPATGLVVGADEETKAAVAIEIPVRGLLSNMGKLLKGVVLHPGVCAYEDESPKASVKRWFLNIDTDVYKLVLEEDKRDDGPTRASLAPRAPQKPKAKKTEAKKDECEVLS